MNSIAAIGASMMQQASSMASRGALRIAATQAEPPTQMPAKQSQAIPSKALSLDPQEFGLIEGTLDLIRAEAAYKAGAAIIRTGDEILEETLKLI